MWVRTAGPMGVAPAKESQRNVRSEARSAAQLGNAPKMGPARGTSTTQVGIDAARDERRRHR